MQPPQIVGYENVIIDIRDYYEMVSNQQSIIEKKFYSAIRGMEDTHNYISPDLNRYLRTVDSNRSTVTENIKEFINDHSMINLPELRQNLIKSIISEWEMLSPCYDTLMIIRQNTQELCHTYGILVTNFIKLDDKELRLWARAFRVLNFLSKEFTNDQMRQDQLTRAGWRKGFLEKYFTKMPTNLDFRELDKSIVKAVLYLRSRNAPPEVKDILAVADDMYHLRKRITHKLINPGDLDLYLDYAKGAIVQKILNSYQMHKWIAPLNVEILSASL